MQRLVACVLLLSAASVKAAPVAHWDPGGVGFIDDAFASIDGKTVAFITTDGASTASLHLATIGGGDVKVDNVPFDAVELRVLGPERVLMVHGTEGSLSALVFTKAGPEKQQLGPFQQVALTKVDGKPAIVTYTRNDKKGVQHEFVAYDVERLKPFKKKTLVEDAEGAIKIGRTQLKPLWWSDGFTILNARKPGEYDKAHDVREPDRYTRLDVFSGKIVAEEPVKDVIAFAKVALIRRDHPNEHVIVHYSDDRKQVLMLDGLVEHELALARPIWKYEPQSLGAQTLDDKREAMTLTVDPVNPDAVNRQKTEPDDIDVYAIDRQSSTATRILTLPGQGRPSRMRVAGNRLLLLRKDKGFDRGGVALEVYDLPSEH